MAKKITKNVNKDKFLNDLPKVKVPNSQWIAEETNYQASNLGEIVPIFYEEILPGQYKGLRMAMNSHLTTPVAPFFNAVYTEIRAFWVPMRLAADLLNGYKTRKSPWVKVFGEDNASESSEIVVKLEDQALPEFTEYHQFIKDVESYNEDSPSDNVFDSLDLYMESDQELEYANQNFLTLAAYELIYQRHYRNENFESATSSPLYRLLFDAYNEDKASVSLPLTFTFEMANREKDYFTGMKPFTQKGDPVTLDLIHDAPVYGTGEQVELINGDVSSTLVTEGATEDEGYTGAGLFVSGAIADKSALHYPTKAELNGRTPRLFADLRSIKGISIEELRMLIKTQELLEKDAVYGSRYAESLNAHFATCPIDETLQDPAELSRRIITSNMQAVFQTSTTQGEQTILGSIGANSTTQTDIIEILPRTKFKEHGILMVCAVHKLQNVYDAKYFKPKFNFKRRRFDFYTPELNDMGFQPVTNKEFRTLRVGDVAGYNEAFAEYRYKFNKVHGSMATAYKFWAPAIADEYGAVATLYKESPDILDKALSQDSTVAPQFYDAWGFESFEDKPMSLHSIPGMDGVI